MRCETGIGMTNKTHPVERDASLVIEAFLAANPHPTSEQWKALTLAYPQYAIQIAETSLMFCIDETDVDTEATFDVELFNATRSAMLSATHANTAPVDAAKFALKQCKGPSARNFARQIGLGERVDLFNQMVSGEISAPYVLLKRLASKLEVRLAALAEVFSLNFQNQQVQSFKADGKPIASRRPASWEEAVKAAGVTGDEAARLLLLEKEME